MIIQTFMESIYQGEISIIYFNNKYSHAVKKIPSNG
jgi:hypothetical protein